jgi:HEAT repeat protein
VVFLAIGFVASGSALYLHSRPVPRAERLLARGLDHEARELLVGAADDRPEDARVRALLGRALFKLAQPAAALDSYEIAWRIDPAILDRTDLDALANALSRRGKVAERAARLLARAGPAAGPMVLAVLPRTSGAERVRAIELLRAIDPGQAIDAVSSWSPLLEDPDCDVRRAAVMRLGDSGDPAAIPHLQTLAGLREGRAPPGTSPGSSVPSVCGALEAGEALARLQSAAPGR